MKNKRNILIKFRYYNNILIYINYIMCGIFSILYVFEIIVAFEAQCIVFMRFKQTYCYRKAYFLYIYYIVYKNNKNI